MPPDIVKLGRTPGIGLALSGGGFRAALFHAGALLRMNELGLLQQVGKISSVSGGSLISGYLAVKWPLLNWNNTVGPGLSTATNFRTVIVDMIYSYCGKDIEGTAWSGVLVPWEHAAENLEDEFEKNLYGSGTLQTLPSGPGIPEFMFLSTNLQTGAALRFTKAYVADHKIGVIQDPTFKIAQAVTASAAFPPVYTPYRLDLGPMTWDTSKGDTPLDPNFLDPIYATDGGVYDNIALEPVQSLFQNVFVSDGGAPLLPTLLKPSGWQKAVSWSYLGAYSFYQVVEILQEQTLARRRHDLITQFQSNPKTGAFWGLSTRIGDYGLADSLSVSEATRQCMMNISTHFHDPGETQRQQLVNYGYALADAAIRKYYVGKMVATKPQFPYP